MNNYYISLFLWLALWNYGTAYSQNSLENVLSEISRNNKSLQAYQQLLEAKKLGFKTNLYPNNPVVEYEFMKGAPENAGNQTDITAIQTIDFPTAYAKRKDVSQANIEKLEILYNKYRQEVLLEAKLTYLKLVYFNKYKNELTARKDNAQKLKSAIQNKFEAGEASILEVNKAKINLLNVTTELQETEIEIHKATQHLARLNGGNEIVVNDSIYPQPEPLQLLEEIIAEAKEQDYTLQSIRQDQQISREKAELQKALALPKLQGGYRYQSILNQQYNGFHAGISIPLFESKNKVKAVEQEVLYYQALEESHITEHHTELEALYEKTLNLRQRMSEYNRLLTDINSEALLTKALELGEISSIEFFLELSYYYQMMDQYLLTEHDYYQSVAKLRKYGL